MSTADSINVYNALPPLLCLRDVVKYNFQVPTTLQIHDSLDSLKILHMSRTRPVPAYRA